MRETNKDICSRVNALDVEIKDGYDKLLRWIIPYSDCFCLTYQGGWYEDFVESKWSFLNDSMIRYEICQMSGPPEVVLYLRLDHVTIEFLKSKENLYDFCDYVEDGDSLECLWDLCFVKDEKRFFKSITHEKEYRIIE